MTAVPLGPNPIARMLAASRGVLLPEAPVAEMCGRCGRPVLVMCQRMTGFCSQNCEQPEQPKGEGI